MDLKINPIINSLNGEIIAPGSKSYSHRAFIAASLAEGISIIKKPIDTGDVGITIDILRSLGVKIIKIDENSYIVEHTSESFKSIKKVLDCKNSGTTIRIFSALGLLIKDGVILAGEFLKRKRPILPLLEALSFLGGKYRLSEEGVHVKRTKNLCNKVKIPGDISSQFITALLIVCPLLKCKNADYIEIELTSPLVSVPYIKITIDVLNSFGIYIQEDYVKGKFYITNDQQYRPQSYKIPGDFSSSSFIIVAAVLSRKPSKVIIKNLNTQNFQGDKKIIEILTKMGANIQFDELRECISINGNLNKFKLKGLDIDCRDIPDLFPILSILGAFAEGKTTLYNASHLRNKESDRISIMARELTKMGVKIDEKSDKLTIFHSDKIKGIKISHENDHRIAMACCIAALYANSSSLIENVQIIGDSYPSFLDDLKNLGALIEII